MKTSEALTTGSIYTRAQLRALFGITDATLNTGVFRPRRHDSVWLFVTERKSPDRTQYTDLLAGDELDWDGQTSGRTDALIVEHESRGLELLVFYRCEKYEFPEAGFRYEGQFRYHSHCGAHPRNSSLSVFTGGAQPNPSLQRTRYARR